MDQPIDEPVFIRTAYNYDMDKASLESGLHCPEDTLTQQQFKEETEMRNIVERFGLTGQLPTNVSAPQYGDYTDVDDFQSAMQAVRRAEEQFMLFPAHVRERFANDPQRLLTFVSDASNREEAIKLGFINLPPTPEPFPEPPKSP